MLQYFWRARLTALSDPKDRQSWPIFSDHSRHAGAHLYAATARFVFRAILDAGTAIAAASSATRPDRVAHRRIKRPGADYLGTSHWENNIRETDSGQICVPMTPG